MDFDDAVSLLHWMLALEIGEGVCEVGLWMVFGIVLFLNIPMPNE